MEQLDLLERISELEREIAALPPGNLSIKKQQGNRTAALSAHTE